MEYQTLISKLRNLVGFLFGVVFLLASTAQADLLTEDFTSRSYFVSGTEILNQVLGFAHPPMQIAGWQDICGASTNTAIDYGDGHHGSFDPTTYSTFGTYASSVIYINTDTYPTLYVTNFTLNVGDTIQPIGSNPLIIKSLSDIIINGTIDCSGPTGQGATGGSGRCGGGNGGNAGTAGTVGEAAAATITAGGGATGTSGAGGGGGGGFYWIAPCPGSAGTHGATAGAGATPGAAGANFMDAGFTKTGGGAGGGGGAPSATLAGGGGGAGGGRVELIAVRNITLGAGAFINSNGGSGASSSGDSGGGGGGAGGSVKIHAGLAVSINAAANVRVQNGTSGTSVIGSAGGNGGWGRVWVINGSGAGFGTGTTVDAADLSLLSLGTIQFLTGAYSMTTGTYDLVNTKTTFSNVITTLINSANGTATITVNGSKNGFAVDSTGFQPLVNFAALSGSRYIQFNASINNTSTTAPIELDAIALTYTPGPTYSYNYVAGCGSVGKIDQRPTALGALILFFVFMLPLAVLGVQRVRF